MTLALRCAIAVVTLISLGCGTTPSDSPYDLRDEDTIGFQVYPMRDTTYQEVVQVVRDVTKEYSTARFGGVTIEWIEETHLLKVSPVYDDSGSRRMTLFIHLEPVKNGVDVAMLALVEQLRFDGGVVGWGDAKMDGYVEESLHLAFLYEIERRRIKANASP